jgi:hypothetical protein
MLAGPAFFCKGSDFVLWKCAWLSLWIPLATMGMRDKETFSKSKG